MKRKILLSAFFLFVWSFTSAGAETTASVPPEEALQRLVHGNERFAAWKSQHPHQDKARLNEVAQGQKPFAVVLTCADSRVPPEMLFDQGLGDLFVVRVAGNVVSPEVLGSIEYAVEHLGTHLIFVLGHECCGAVEAALQGGKLPGHISTLASEIRPALKAASCPAQGGMACAVKANVDYVVKEIASSRPLLAELVKSGTVKVLGGYYSLDTGQVSLQP